MQHNVFVFKFKIWLNLFGLIPFSFSATMITNKRSGLLSFSAVMQTDGFEYLKESCPSVLTELLQHVAQIGEHSVIASGYNEITLDGCDVNGRRVKPRTH